MPIIRSRYKNREKAEKFFQKMRAKGYRPFMTLERKGIKITHVVEYNIPSKKEWI